MGFDRKELWILNMICAVIENITNKQINMIVAEPTDVPPDGCRLVEIPEGYYWNGVKFVLMEVPDGS